MSALITGIVILAVVIFMIVRQFQERAVQFPGIFILPALITYYTYIAIQAEFTKHVLDPAWLIAALLVGLISGLALGFFRGNLAHLRSDAATGKIYAKASTLSLVIWSILLVLRIGAAALSYSSLGQMLLPLVVLFSILHTLFLGNIIAEKFCLCQKAARYRQMAQQPVQVQKIKW